MKEFNQGYEIIAAETYQTDTVGESRIVLGFRETQLGPAYVTWESDTNVAGRRDYFWGHTTSAMKEKPAPTITGAFSATTKGEVDDVDAGNGSGVIVAAKPFPVDESWEILETEVCLVVGGWINSLNLGCTRNQHGAEYAVWESSRPVHQPDRVPNNFRGCRFDNEPAARAFYQRRLAEKRGPRGKET